MNRTIKKVKRGAEFALVGAGRSGVHQVDRKGYKIRNDRKEVKADLRKYLR
jgi:hypothetical protein